MGLATLRTQMPASTPITGLPSRSLSLLTQLMERLPCVKKSISRAPPNRSATSDADASFVSDCGTPGAEVPLYTYTDPVLLRHLCSDATGGESLSPKELPSSPPVGRDGGSPSYTQATGLAGDVGGGIAPMLLPPPSQSSAPASAVVPEETTVLQEPSAGVGGSEAAAQPHDSPLSLPYRTVGSSPSHLPPLRPALDIPSAAPRRRNAMDNDSERPVPYQKTPPRQKWTFWKPGRYCYYHRTISDVARCGTPRVYSGVPMLT